MAANTNVKVTISGDSTGADRAFKSATASARAMQKQLEAQQAVMTGVGQAMMAGGALMAAGLGLAARAAVQWESAFAGVRKTTDVSGLSAAAAEKEFARLDAGLRDMAKNLPATHQEIAAVAEAAGQLGVKRDDVLGFTKVMIDLGETTNLTADEAATALARLMNVMGTSSTDVSRLGSTIVALGNNSATTEAEIVAMATRISGAGTQIGMSESDVLSFSAALSSVGIEAEAGGTAISQTFVKIQKAVMEGGDTLDGFAEVAGMTAEEFRTAYADDAAGAIVTFIEGLGGIKDAGGNTFQTMEDLGLTGIRLQDALLRSSAAGDLLRTSLDLGSTAWEENTALLAEAEQRYGTTEAKMQIARNAINDTAITIGQQMLPALGELAEDVGTTVTAFGNLPDPVQRAGTALGIAAAAVGLVGGAALIAVPKIAALQTSLVNMGPAGARAATGLRALTAAAGPIGIALAAITTVGGIALNSWVDQKQAVEDYAASLDQATGAVGEATRVLAVKTLQDEGALAAAENLGLSLDVVTDAALGNANAMAQVNARLEEVRAAEEGYNEVQAQTGGLASQTSQDVYLLQGALSSNNETLTKAQEETRQAAAAMGESGDAAAGAADQQAALEEALASATTQTESSEAALDELRTTLQSLLVDTFSVEAATDAFESQIVSLTEQVKSATDAGDKNAASLKGNSAAALANREAMRGLTAASEQIILKMIEHRASSEAVTAETQRLKGRLDDTGAALGMTAEEVARYSGQLDAVPDAVSTTISTPGSDRAVREAQAVQRALAAIDTSIRVDITTYRTEIKRDFAAASRGGTNPPASAGVDRRARGGPVQKGKEYLVGEEGQELMVAPSDGYIIDATRTAAILAGGYGLPRPLVPASSFPQPPAPGVSGQGGPLLNIEHVDAGLDRATWMQLGRDAADAAQRELAAQVVL